MRCCDNLLKVSNQSPKEFVIGLGKSLVGGNFKITNELRINAAHKQEKKNIGVYQQPFAAISTKQRFEKLKAHSSLRILIETTFPVRAFTLNTLNFRTGPGGPNKVGWVWFLKAATEEAL